MRGEGLGGGRFEVGVKALRDFEALTVGEESRNGFEGCRLSFARDGVFGARTGSRNHNRCHLEQLIFIPVRRIGVFGCIAFRVVATGAPTALNAPRGWLVSFAGTATRFRDGST